MQPTTSKTDEAAATQSAPAASAWADANSGAIRQRLLRGFGAHAYEQIITVVVQLAGVPILLHAWGTQLYGEWLILFAIPAYLSMTDLGFSQSAANDMTARVARGDHAGALRVFQSLGVLVYGMSALALIATIVLIPQLPLSDWLNFQALEGQTAQWILWLLTAQVLVTLPGSVAHAGFRASGEYALHHTLHATVRLVQFAGVWVAALAGGGPVVAAAAFLAIRAFGTAGLSLLVVKRHRWLSYGTAMVDIAELRRLLRPALANTAIPLAQALNIQGMVIAVGAVLGPVAVVIFSTLRTLTRLAMQMVMIVAKATEPELAAAYGTENRELLRRLFFTSVRGGVWLALFAAGGLALFGNEILEYWTRGRVAMDQALFAWLLASAVASVFWFGGLTLLKAANRHLLAACVYVLASAASVGVAAGLLHWTGELALAGVALLAMDATMAGYSLTTAARLLGERPGSLLLQMMDLRSVATRAWPRAFLWRR